MKGVQALSSSIAFDAQDGCDKADHLNMPQFPLVCSAGDYTNATVCHCMKFNLSGLGSILGQPEEKVRGLYTM